MAQLLCPKCGNSSFEIGVKKVLYYKVRYDKGEKLHILKDNGKEDQEGKTPIAWCRECDTEWKVPNEFWRSVKYTT